jgi:hypothetical protein
MHPVSSKMTFFYKRVFPVIWFGVLLLFLAFALFALSHDGTASNITLVIMLPSMGIASYQFMKKMAFNLADEVLDAGNALVVRNGGQEEALRFTTSRTSIIRLT